MVKPCKERWDLYTHDMNQADKYEAIDRTCVMGNKDSCEETYLGENKLR
eukprot:UN16192